MCSSHHMTSTSAYMGVWQLDRVWKETVKHTLSSRFHLDVSKMLRDMGIAHDFEYVTEDGLFSLDIATAGPRGPVAIEVDGPYHFTLNTRQPLGSTLIRCAHPRPSCLRHIHQLF